MDVIEIVREYLEEKNFDGLFSEFGECACLTNDLVPCDSCFDLCQPGYRTSCDCGEGHDFHISEVRELDEAELAISDTCD